jgi:hypothetical protein
MTASPGRPATRAERCAGRLITTLKALDSGIVVVNDSLRRFVSSEAVSTGRAFRIGRAGQARTAKPGDRQTKASRWALSALASWKPA